MTGHEATIGLGTLYVALLADGSYGSQTYMVIEPSPDAPAFSHVIVSEVTDQGIPQWSGFPGTGYPSEIAFLIGDVSPADVRLGFQGDESLVESFESMITNGEQQGRRVISLPFSDPLGDAGAIG